MRGFVRTSVAVPVVAVADPAENALRTLALWQQAHDDGVALVVFPELGLSSYTARDLFFDDTMTSAVETALASLVDASKALAPLALVGMPLRTPLGLYNVAVAIQAGRVLGCVPKSYLPNYREFEEKRWFREGREVPAGAVCTVLGRADVPFGPDLLLCASDHVDDGEIESTAVHLRVVVPAVREQRDSRLLQPGDVRGVVDDAHRVGLREAHADRVGERVALGGERGIDERVGHAQASASAVGWIRPVVSFRRWPERPER